MGSDRNILGQILDWCIIRALCLLLFTGFLIFLFYIFAVEIVQRFVEFVRRYCIPCAIGVGTMIMTLLTQMAGILQRLLICVCVSLRKIVKKLNKNVGTVLTLFGIVLTLVALGATLYQFRIVSGQLILQSEQSKQQAGQVREQLKIQRDELEIQRGQLHDQTENTKKQIAAEQFKNAIEHLGSQEQPVVLGGVHALHNLAMNFPEQYSQPVFEVLCSFIREATADPDYKPKSRQIYQQIILNIIIRYISQYMQLEKNRKKRTRNPIR